MQIWIPLFMLMLIRLWIQFFLARVRQKIFLKIFNYRFQNLIKLVMCNFLSKNAGAGVRDKGGGVREEG